MNAVCVHICVAALSGDTESIIVWLGLHGVSGLVAAGACVPMLTVCGRSLAVCQTHPFDWANCRLIGCWPMFGDGN